MKHRSSARFVLYTAVLPAYRAACLELLRRELGSDLEIFSGAAHLDPSVRTGVAPELYHPVRNLRWARGRLLVQAGSWLRVLRAGTAVLDLNPRSLTAWVLLAARRLTRRRTLVWGHLHPQRGAASRTAGLRIAMRRLASGTVLYGYDSVVAARAEVPNRPVWVAPNAVYRQKDIHVSSGADRNAVVYVGRLEPAKKVDLLIRAFGRSRLAEHGTELVLVGHGSDHDRLRRLAEELNLGASCRFAGRIYDVIRLADLYAQAFCSASPGYAGLGLTQSIGFGVPVAVADAEPHSPEIELQRSGAVHYFPSDSPEGLATALRELSGSWTHSDAVRWSRAVAVSYSAESMAAGLVSAFRGTPQSLDGKGWPADAR